MAAPLLTLQDVHLTFGGTPLLVGADLSVGEGERLCLVGRNGSGKSTLLKIAGGLIEADQGLRVVQTGVTMRYLPQEPSFGNSQTTLEYVEAGLSPGDDSYRALYLLNELGLTGHENVGQLSGGEARRAALACALAPAPDVLLLDEPTNHLDLPAVEWLEKELSNMRSALVLISHDRKFLETLSKATIWLDRGATRRTERGFTHFESWRDDVLQSEEEEARRLDKKIAAELEWVRYGVTARRKRNMGRMRALDALRQRHSEQRSQSSAARMTATDAEASGKLVIEAVNVSKSFGDAAIVRDFSIRIARGDRVGIVGRNGAGKTTLLSLLTGELNPDSGCVRIGANLQMVSLDQKRSSLTPDMTLTEALTGGSGDTVFAGGVARHVFSYMKDFLFLPEQARTPVSSLSGGERGRLMLARALAVPSNLLVLDEPTNDLDLETLDLLEEMLSSYEGTVLLVSHDRDFLDRVVTSVIAAEEQGKWTTYAGGYSDMIWQRGGDLAARERASTRKIKRPDPTPVQSASSIARRRLSPKQQHGLKVLPELIKRLQAEVAKEQAALSTGDIYSRDPAAFTLRAEALERLQSKLNAAEDEWLELEILREEIES
ncbi:ATP-binding cassette subfamily F protein uup [Rhodoligotrophos appendicifer]|uniref:ABC-F family ATP-binding cassette domain-containing protein n=1 Tax=Rhodoligotrophos appendicifer TaxID=987056 RepID=UPI0011864ABE|nr:ABC-F family ATP-binding cassette domain-containing protein [Rhodoligotrophos appendicifer]